MVDQAYEAVTAKDPGIAQLFPTEEERREWIGAAIALVRAYFSLEDPTRLAPEAREMFIEVTLPGDGELRLRGFIDRLDVAPATGALRVVDYKTGRAPSPRFAGEAQFQLRCYALALWRERGVIPAMLQLIYLGSGTIVRYEPTQVDLEQTEALLHALWASIEQTALSGQWPAVRGPLCSWCAHQGICPEFGGVPPAVPSDGLERLGISRRDTGSGEEVVG
jgi:putative RecB family exonuclease